MARRIAGIAGLCHHACVSCFKAYLFQQTTRPVKYKTIENVGIYLFNLFRLLTTVTFSVNWMQAIRPYRTVYREGQTPCLARSQSAAGGLHDLGGSEKSGKLLQKLRLSLPSSRGKVTVWRSACHTSVTHNGLRHPHLIIPSVANGSCVCLNARTCTSLSSPEELNGDKRACSALSCQQDLHRQL